MYIYLDESGDLGLDLSKKGTSNYFVITLLLCFDSDAAKAFRIAVKRTIRNKLKCKANCKRYELKGTNTSLAVKQYFYRQVKSDNWKIYSVILNKKRVFEKFKGARGQSKIYNFLAKFIIEKLPLRDSRSNVRLVVDKSKNRAEIQDFNQYIKTYIEGSLPLNTGFSVEHLSSNEDGCLQAVDMFCWGISRKYKKDRQWYDIFASKIDYEDVYLP